MALFFHPRKSISAQNVRTALEVMASIPPNPQMSAQHVVADYLRSNVALGTLLAEETVGPGAKLVNWWTVILVTLAEVILFVFAYCAEASTDHPGLSENLYSAFQALFALSIAAISFEGVKDNVPIKLRG